MSKIKKINIVPNKIKVSATITETFDYPIFCFKHLQTIPKANFKFYADFITRLKKISSLTWNEISNADRHGFGTEKMPVNQIKLGLPKFITPDVKYLLVFRASGDNRPFLGLRNGTVFHIIFIEEQFGDVYSH